jgi:hypothetical protein
MKMNFDAPKTVKNGKLGTLFRTLSHFLHFLLYMNYEKYWFHLQKKIIANFHVLGLFIPKKRV